MRTTLALVLASSLAAPLWARAGETGILTGLVIPSADGRTIAKAVWVGSAASPVAADGTFRVEGLPGGPAKLAIETSEGLYVASSPVAIAPGTTRRVHLAFGGRQDTSAPPPPEKATKKKRVGVWANPLTATLIVVGAAIVLGVSVDQLTKADPASPSMP